MLCPIWFSAGFCYGDYVGRLMVWVWYKSVPSVGHFSLL